MSMSPAARVITLALAALAADGGRHRVPKVL